MARRLMVTDGDDIEEANCMSELVWNRATRILGVVCPEKREMRAYTAVLHYKHDDYMRVLALCAAVRTRWPEPQRAAKRLLTSDVLDTWIATVHLGLNNWQAMCDHLVELIAAVELQAAA